MFTEKVLTNKNCMYYILVSELYSKPRASAPSKILKYAIKSFKITSQ